MAIVHGDFRIRADRIELSQAMQRRPKDTIAGHPDRSLGEWEFKLEGGAMFFGCKAWEFILSHGPEPLGIADIASN